LKILDFNQKQGEIAIKIDSLNDLWTLYNVISKNDKVVSRTQRRVVLKEGSKGERKSMFLKLNVEDISFHEFSNRLRVKGTILEGPEDFVSFGSYHTFNIETGQKLTIIKENWSSLEMKRLKQSSKFETNFVILMIAIETGLATIEMITNFSQNRIATIKSHIPGKRYEQSHRNKAVTDFFENVKKVIEENVNSSNIDLIIFCGPGNTRDLLLNYLKEKYNPDYIHKIRSIHASSGTESAIRETLKSKELAGLKEKVKILQETEKIEEIFKLFNTEPDLISIGLNENSKASERGAVKQLFVADLLIRGTSKSQKLEIENIITNVENSGGEVDILSSQTSTGQQIIDLGSIVGILRYKL
jgi:protein pelota